MTQHELEALLINWKINSGYREDQRLSDAAFYQGIKDAEEGMAPQSGDPSYLHGYNTVELAEESEEEYKKQTKAINNSVRNPLRTGTNSNRSAED